MPTGTDYPIEFRRLIYSAVIHENLSPEQIMQYLTPCLDNPNISIRYITFLSNKMREDHIWAIKYVSGPCIRVGRPRLLDPFDEHIFLSTIPNHDGATFATLISDYHLLMTGERPLPGNLPISRNTACRIQQRAGITGKVPEYRNINRDEVERLRYMEHMAYVDPEVLVDIDETSQAPGTFKNSYGRSIRGEACVRDQIVIGDRSFSTIAALTPRGFICHSIFEGGVGAEEFGQFLNLLEPRMHVGQVWGIIDNAAIHHTDEIRIRLQQVFVGRFTFCARYSPDLKPVERAFALVKNYIRINYDRALQDPLAMINEAFELFSIGGEKAGSVYNFFNLYRRSRFNYFN